MRGRFGMTFGWGICCWRLCQGFHNALVTWPSQPLHRHSEWQESSWFPRTRQTPFNCAICNVRVRMRLLLLQDWGRIKSVGCAWVNQLANTGDPSHLHLLVLPDAIRCGSLISDEWGGILIGMRSWPDPLWREGEVLPEWWHCQPALAYS